MCQTCGSKAIHKQCMTQNSSIFTCNDCTDILKKRNINVKHILENNTNEDDDDDELENNKNNTDEENGQDINVTDYTSDVSDDNNDDSLDLSEESKRESTEIEDNDITRKEYIRSKINKLRVDSDDEIENNESYNLKEKHEESEENYVNKSNNNNNNNQYKVDLKNKENCNNRSPSCSSLESINDVIREQQPRKNCIRRLSESSTSTISSNIPLSHLLRNKVLTSNASSYKNDHENDNKSSVAVENILSSSSLITSSSSSSLSSSVIKTNSVERKKRGRRKTISLSSPTNKCNENNKKRKNNGRCSSLGYVSDNSPRNSSSTENLKPDANDNSEKENQKNDKKIIRRRKRSIIDNDNWSDIELNNKLSSSISDDLNDSNSFDSGRRLRKRKKAKAIPYQLRQRSDSISYGM